MNESEWRITRDPNAQLDLLRYCNSAAVKPHGIAGHPCTQPFFSDRQLLLFACASARHYFFCPGSFVPSDALSYLRVDRLITQAEARADDQTLGCQTNIQVSGLDVLQCDGEQAAAQWCSYRRNRRLKDTQAEIFRDLAGSPSSPVSLPATCRFCGHSKGDSAKCLSAVCKKRTKDRDIPWVSPWRTSLVVAMATAIYQDSHVRKPEDGDLPLGYLSPTRLLVLADALEEAGCSWGTCPYLAEGESRCPRHCVCHGEKEVLHPLQTHLRAMERHWRGCWAVDLLRDWTLG